MLIEKVGTDTGMNHSIPPKSGLLRPGLIALFDIDLSGAGPHGDSTLVAFVPANGVEQKASITRAAIMKWLAVNNVVRQPGD